MAGLLNRDDSVLVVVDAQPGFFRKDWFTREDNAASRAAIDRAAWLVAVASKLGIPVVVTEEEPERNGPTEPLIGERLPAGTPVLRKGTFGLGGSPEILDAVRGTRRSTAVVVGCETDVCVAQSAISLLEHGLRCVVVEDAAFSPGEMHVRGLERLVSAGVARNHAKGVTYEWLATVDDAHRMFGEPDLPAAPFRL
jgi:nicotinamidase-related amidase